MLTKDPQPRITAKEALNHGWIKRMNVQMNSVPFEDADETNDIEDENSKTISVHEKIKIMQQELALYKSIILLFLIFLYRKLTYFNIFKYKIMFFSFF